MDFHACITILCQIVEKKRNKKKTEKEKLDGIVRMIFEFVFIRIHEYFKIKEKSERERKRKTGNMCVCVYIIYAYIESSKIIS